MINPEPLNHTSTLASLAEMYSRAFAMAAAANSCSGLALRRAENPAFNLHRYWVDEPGSGNPANTNAILKFN
jgi:hypothetical protein